MGPVFGHTQCSAYTVCAADGNWVGENCAWVVPIHSSWTLITNSVNKNDAQSYYAFKAVKEKEEI